MSFAICLLLAVSGCGGSQPDGSTISDTTDKISSNAIETDDTYEKDGVIYVGEDTKVSAEITVKNFGDFSSESDKEANELRKEIIEAKDTIKAKGTTWYISNDGDDDNEGNSPEKAWKTLNALASNEYKIKEGDAVLFNRGDIFRGNLNTISGVSYGAYGKGDKPTIYGCKTNYAKEIWRLTSEENIYAMINASSSDVGMIIFNHGEAYGNKKIDNVFECDEDYEFYHDRENGIVYLYYSKGVPSDIFYDIEFLSNKRIIQIKNNQENIYIENLCLKYTGAHAISVGMPVRGITIKNCEIGWIGGSIYKGGSDTTRYGNGIEFYGQTTDAIVDHCWVYQCYDTGLTHQYGGSPTSNPEMSAENITYTKNLIEFCSYSFEYFWGWSEKGVQTYNPNVYMKDILIKDNIMRFAGYGLGKNRPDLANVGHVITWATSYNDSKNFIVENNIFDTSILNLFNIRTHTTVNPTFTGNKYIQTKDGRLGNVVSEIGASGGEKRINLTLDEASLKSFDKNGTLIIK